MQLDKDTMEHWAKGIRDSSDENNRKSIIANFEFQYPNIDSSWLLDIKPGNGFRGDMIAIEMRAKRERSARIKQAIKAGDYRPKPRVTQTDFDYVIGAAIDAPIDLKGITILEDYSEKSSKPLGWIDTAKVAESRAKVRSSLGKHKTKAVMQQLKVYKQILPYNSDLTSQKLRNVLDTIQRKKSTMAILIDHEIRIRDLEAKVDAHTEILTRLEPTMTNVLMLKSQGFNNTQIAKRINKSVSTVQRLAKKGPVSF